MASTATENTSISYPEVEQDILYSQNFSVQKEDYFGTDELVSQCGGGCSLEDVAADYFSKRLKELDNDSDVLISYLEFVARS